MGATCALQTTSDEGHDYLEMTYYYIILLTAAAGCHGSTPIIMHIFTSGSS